MIQKTPAMNNVLEGNTRGNRTLMLLSKIISLYLPPPSLSSAPPLSLLLHCVCALLHISILIGFGSVPKYGKRKLKLKCHKTSLTFVYVWGVCTVCESKCLFVCLRMWVRAYKLSNDGLGYIKVRDNSYDNNDINNNINKNKHKHIGVIIIIIIIIIFITIIIIIIIKLILVFMTSTLPTTITWQTTTLWINNINNTRR